MAISTSNIIIVILASAVTLTIVACGGGGAAAIWQQPAGSTNPVQPCPHCHLHIALCNVQAPLVYPVKCELCACALHIVICTLQWAM